MRLLNTLRKPIVIEVVFSNNATKHLIKQAQYIFERTQSEAQTDQYLDKMKHYIVEILSHFPFSGRPSDEISTNTRKLVYQGYSIIYKITPKRAEILMIYRENLPA